MPPTVDYHCPCLSQSSVPPPPHLPSSSHSFHSLHTLFFCEECDAVRCNRCVSVEVSGYYCPNCLFEVPSASVRAEKNRCARNCFMCPNCRNTLAVVPSDPPDNGDGRLAIPISTIGEPPFFLYCNHCRWDSAEVGITFEKPTGLAAQLQKFEDSAPDSLEFERLKEHFEPVIRASSLSSSTSNAPAAPPSSAAHSHRVRTNSITAAASAALARDIPGVSKYNPLARSGRGGGSNKDKTANRDEMPEYRSRVDIVSASARGTGGGEADVDYMRHFENVSEVASLEQRWVNSWATSLQTADLKPLRIPLHSKRSKRCPACAHILIKPEQKAQSVRYKIKLVAANYLPAITAALPHQLEAANPDTAKRTLGKSTGAAADDERGTAGMHAGKTYPFHLVLTNPLYDPIQVRLTVQRVHASATTGASSSSGRASPEKARRPPFAVSLPSGSFPIAAFAEAWEYEDDEDDDMFGLDDDDEFGIAGRAAGREKDSRGKLKMVGVLEKKANVTVVGGEVVIGKEARGNVKFNMLVSYTYRSDDPTPSESNEGESTASKAAASKPPEIKTFAFYTVVDLGPIIPREEPRVESDF
ncbi:dynactin p62 family-domain-containing protein [Mycena latifolia]|nr:dynactin p62 family-domain-containing protein [Mycena latifolia]